MVCTLHLIYTLTLWCATGQEVHEHVKRKHTSTYEKLVSSELVVSLFQLLVVKKIKALDYSMNTTK